MKIKWVTFTKRTEDPKLAYLEHLLTLAEISHRRNGESFHAPILEVPEDQLDAADAVLQSPARKAYDLPVRYGVSFDDVPDNHHCFYQPNYSARFWEDVPEWWVEPPSDWVKTCSLEDDPCGECQQCIEEGETGSFDPKRDGWVDSSGRP